MSHRDSISLTRRAGLSLRLLIEPTRGNFRDIARAADGHWGRSLLLCSGATTGTIAAALTAAGIPIAQDFLASTPISITLLALSWAAVAQAVTTRILGRNHNVFDPLLYLSATSFLLLLLLSILLGILPGSPILISVLPLAYSQVLSALAIRAIGHTTLAKSVTVIFLADIVGFVLARMGSQIILGMPGFFERGYLI